MYMRMCNRTSFELLSILLFFGLCSFLYIIPMKANLDGRISRANGLEVHHSSRETVGMKVKGVDSADVKNE